MMNFSKSQNIPKKILRQFSAPTFRKPQDCTDKIFAEAVRNRIFSYETLFSEILNLLPERQKELLYAVAKERKGKSKRLLPVNLLKNIRFILPLQHKRRQDNYLKKKFLHEMKTFIRFTTGFSDYGCKHITKLIIIS